MRTTFRLFLSCLFYFALPLANGYGSENDALLAEQEHKPGDRMVLKIQDVEYAFRWCPAGTFTMGSRLHEKGWEPSQQRQQVTLSHGFWMLETEVTQAMWESVMDNNPSHFKGNNLPVEQVSWDDCQAYIKKLNNLLADTPDAPTGFEFSLPTEAQWEYACRAGTTMTFHFGDTLSQEQANFNRSLTRDVGSYPANAWGLYDMHGNVSEWCHNWFEDYRVYAAFDHWGLPIGSSRASRGGSWNDDAENCRSAARSNGTPAFEKFGFGLRLSLVTRAEVKSRVRFLSQTWLPAFPQPYGRMCFQVQEAISKGNVAEADRIAQECITLAETRDEHPDSVYTLHGTLGNMFLDASMFDSAHRHFSEFAKRGGRYVYQLARCKAKSGDIDGGLSLLLDEIDHDPSVRDDLLPFFVVLLQQVKPPSETMFGTLDILMESVETEGHLSTTTIADLADYWIIRDKPERAIPLLEECLTRDDLPYGWGFRFSYHLAKLYSQVRQHQKALEVVNKALEARMDHVLLDTKGLILINAGNPTEAIPVLRRVVELTNHFPFYCMHLAYALHLDGRDAESRQHFVAARDQLTSLIPDMTKENKAMYDVLMRAHP